MDQVQLPPELSNLMPNNDWYSESDVFGIEFTPTLDQAIGTISYNFPESSDAGVVAPPRDPLTTNNAQKRHAIYQNSPWYLRPQCVQEDLLTSGQAVETGCQPKCLQRGQQHPARRADCQQCHVPADATSALPSRSGATFTRDERQDLSPNHQDGALTPGHSPISFRKCP